ncbi:unnamed protein product [Schistosoma mattheei]|uniref:Uncharacterized protein n=1 Tax=Schistosoma mattheei TaxID=31246 RepID=A0A3P8FNC3_9TREM|nr:unnamed protein product [Schistosoma mattheei]
MEHFLLLPKNEWVQTFVFLWADNCFRNLCLVQLRTDRYNKREVPCIASTSHLNSVCWHGGGSRKESCLQISLSLEL